MNSNYQNMNNYSGSLYGTPKYDGISYDWEVPDNLVIASPGGVSSVHHHWTRGFDGIGNTSSDIYAGQGQRYNAGTFGNLYQTGHKAGQAMGYYPAAPDHKFWDNQTPQQFSYTHSGEESYQPFENENLFNKKKSSLEQNIEGYNSTPEYDIGNYHPDNQKINSSNIKFFDEPDNNYIAETPFGDVVESKALLKAETTPGNLVVSTQIPPWALFLLFLLAFIAFSFWAETALLFLKQHLHQGEDPSWKRFLFYSFLATVIFSIIIYLSGVPITTFESL
jgi:hypothetical protein